jgi:hypothetical protein
MLSDDEHKELQSLLGAFALDAVDADEAHRVQGHLVDCPPCREEVAGYLEVTGLLPLVLGAEDTDVDDEEVVADVVPLRRPARWLSVAAVVAIVALSAGLVVQTRRLGTAEQELAQADLVTVALAAEGVDGASTLVLADGAGHAVATVVLLPDGTGLLTIEDLPEVGDDRTYQLWGVMDDEVVSVGLAGVGPGTTAFTADAVRLQALVLTEEEAGGVAVSEADPLALVSLSQ